MTGGTLTRGRHFHFAKFLANRYRGGQTQGPAPEPGARGSFGIRASGLVMIVNRPPDAMLPGPGAPCQARRAAAVKGVARLGTGAPPSAHRRGSKSRWRSQTFRPSSGCATTYASPEALRTWSTTRSRYPRGRSCGVASTTSTSTRTARRSRPRRALSSPPSRSMMAKARCEMLKCEKMSPRRRQGTRTTGLCAARNTRGPHRPPLVLSARATSWWKVSRKGGGMNSRMPETKSLRT
mmetsp:Transcript_16719/g.56168  ORF Transcript_16719/g.56168 Transcript_16719/m.56168 type:complete len:237 (+) Transcript_16719:5-715(+)